MKPLLLQKFNNSWIDPREAKDDSDLIYKYKTAWAHAQAGKEIIALVESMKDKADFLEAKERGEVINKFRIGGK